MTFHKDETGKDLFRDALWSRREEGDEVDALGFPRPSPAACPRTPSSFMYAGDYFPRSLLGSRLPALASPAPFPAPSS